MRRGGRGKSAPDDPIFLAEIAAILEAYQAADRARLTVSDEERAILNRVVTRPFTPYAPLPPAWEPVP
jgi:hypothetical protein